MLSRKLPASAWMKEISPATLASFRNPSFPAARIPGERKGVRQIPTDSLGDLPRRRGRKTGQVPHLRSQLAVPGDLVGRERVGDPLGGGPRVDAPGDQRQLQCVGQGEQEPEVRFEVRRSRGASGARVDCACIVGRHPGEDREERQRGHRELQPAARPQGLQVFLDVRTPVERAGHLDPEPADRADGRELDRVRLNRKSGRGLSLALLPVVEVGEADRQGRHERRACGRLDRRIRRGGGDPPDARLVQGKITGRTQRELPGQHGQLGRVRLLHPIQGILPQRLSVDLQGGCLAEGLDQADPGIGGEAVREVPQGAGPRGTAEGDPPGKLCSPRGERRLRFGLRSVPLGLHLGCGGRGKRTHDRHLGVDRPLVPGARTNANSMPASFFIGRVPPASAPRCPRCRRTRRRTTNRLFLFRQ